MDFLRSCYASKMRLFRDRPDVLVEGAWHWCPPGAKVVPYLHAFGSRQWDPSGMDPPDHVGEVLPRGTYSKGLTPRRYYGQHTCGNAEIWANGVLYAQRGDLAVWPDGVPKCCQTGPSILCLATEDGADLMEESGTACLAPEEG